MFRGTSQSAQTCQLPTTCLAHHTIRRIARCNAVQPSETSGDAAPGQPIRSNNSEEISSLSADTPSSSDTSQPEARSPPPPPFGARRSVADELKLPRSGYFSIADTKAEVYSKAGTVFDPRDKGDRYKSSFIWNTNWSEALSRQESLQRKADKAASDRKSASASSTPSSAGFQAPASATSKIDQANGFVSFTRMADLDRMDVDLSAQLRPRGPKVVAPVDPAAAAAALVIANRRRALNTFTDAGGQTFSRKEVGRLGRTAASQVSEQIVPQYLFGVVRMSRHNSLMHGRAHMRAEQSMVFAGAMYRHSNKRELV